MKALIYNKIWLFTAITATWACSQRLAGQHKLSGTITDKTTRECMVGAIVYISELNKGTVTDAKGSFGISNILPGNYTLQVSYLGYQTRYEHIVVDTANSNKDIMLETSTIEVNEVVISGLYTTSQDESPQEIDVINKADMLQAGASTVMDVIAKTPGVSAITTGALISRPVIRGLSGNRILTVADGVRFETQQWDDEHGIGVNELGTDRIEIIKGPASLLYGPEAMGGVVHFIEDQPAPTGVLTGSASGTMMSNNMGFQTVATLKKANERYNWSIGLLGKLLPDYYYSGYRFRVPNTRLSELGGRANMGINRSWGYTSATYQFNKAYYGILDGKDIEKKPDGSIVNKDTAETEMFAGEVEAPYHAVTNHKISSKTTVLCGASQCNITLGYQHNQRAEYEENGTKEGYNFIDMTLHTLTYDLKWHFPVWHNFSTIVGTQGMYQINRNEPAAKSLLVPNAEINDKGFVALTKYNLQRFNITGGVRFDNRSLQTRTALRDTTVNMAAISKFYSNISASLGATYDIEELLLLRFNVANGYRSPNLNELMANGVKPESQFFEIGNTSFVKEQNVETDFSTVLKSKHFTVEAAVFFNDISNFIFLSPTGSMVSSNIAANKQVPLYRFQQANATITGGEAGINLHPAAMPMVHVEIKFSTLTALHSGTYLPMMPADKITNALFFNFKELRNTKNAYVKIETLTALKQLKVAANEPTSAGYTLLNIAFGATRNVWKFRNVDVAVAINNALDKVYTDHLSRLRPYGIANPGINVVLGIKVPLTPYSSITSLQ